MGGPGAKTLPVDSPKLRLDKFLWQAHFFKGRDLAAEMVQDGHLRLNGQRCVKPAHGVAVGDVLTFAHANRIRVIRILSLGDRRGPTLEAQALYADLDAAPPPDAASFLN